MNDSILITGANGFLGNYLAKHFKDQEYNIIGLDHSEAEEKSHFDQWLKCDLTDDNSVIKAINKIDKTKDLYVIHLAAYYDFSGEDSKLYRELTINGTRRLLTQLKQHKVKQFQFASTLLVMDEIKSDNQLINEESPTNPKWNYPQSKLETENYLKKEHGEIPIVIHRIAGVYDDWCHSPPICEQIVRIFEQKFESFFFPGNKHHGQPFIHIEDLARAFSNTITLRKYLNPFEVFIIGEDEVLSYEKLQNIIGEEIYSLEWPTIRVPKSAAKIGSWIKDKATKEDEFIQPWMVDMADGHFPIDISKARMKLRWEPRIKLQEKLVTMINNLKSDPASWYRYNKKDPENIPDRALTAIDKSTQNQARAHG